jgi:ABC-type lipoprotein export system ATPase subunit
VFQPSTVSYITAPSGYGKSTYLSLISRYQKIQSGNIVFREKNIEHYTYDEYNKNIISMVFQSPYLTNDFIVEEMINIAQFIHNNHNQDIFEKLCELMNINHLRSYYASTLSGGERYRVALLISLLKKHEILLLDEPTAHLDDIIAKEIIEYITYYTKQKSIITLIASHDKNISSSHTVELDKH